MFCMVCTYRLSMRHDGPLKLLPWWRTSTSASGAPTMSDEITGIPPVLGQNWDYDLPSHAQVAGCGRRELCFTLLQKSRICQCRMRSGSSAFGFLDRKRSGYRLPERTRSKRLLSATRERGGRNKEVPFRLLNSKPGVSWCPAKSRLQRDILRGAS